jgi:hypothetical protein
MFEVVVLFCSLNLSPGECRAETALDVVRGPVVANEIMCGLHGQAYIAPTTLPRRSEGEYVKLQCRRLRDRAEAFPRGQATPVAAGTQ